MRVILYIKAEQHSIIKAEQQLLCLIRSLATLAHLVYCRMTFLLFQTFSTSFIRYTVLLFIYLVFIIFGEKLVVQ